MAIHPEAMFDLFEIGNLLQGRNAREAPAQAIFVPGRAQGDWERFPNNRGLLEHADSLARRYLDSSPHPVVIPAHDGSYDGEGRRVSTGYPGFERWREELINLGTPQRCIFGTLIRDGEEKMTHTRAETDGFVRLAKQEKWRSAIVIAYPHQLPRVMGCLLKSLEVENHRMHITPDAPVPHRWDIPVYGSLGAKKMPRRQHIREEIERALEYVEKGYMVPLLQIRDYLLSFQPT